MSLPSSWRCTNDPVRKTLACHLSPDKSLRHFALVEPRCPEALAKDIWPHSNSFSVQKWPKSSDHRWQNVLNWTFWLFLVHFFTKIHWCWRHFWEFWIIGECLTAVKLHCTLLTARCKLCRKNIQTWVRIS